MKNENDFINLGGILSESWENIGENLGQILGRSFEVSSMMSQDVLIRFWVRSYEGSKLVSPGILSIEFLCNSLRVKRVSLGCVSICGSVVGSEWRAAPLAMVIGPPP